MIRQTPDDDPGLSRAQRVARNYRRARRKLLSCRREGVDAVAGYLVRSYLARRLVGLEQRRPETIAPFEATPAEVSAFRAAIRAIELERAIELGGQAQARQIRLEQGLAKLAGEPAQQEMLRRIFGLGGHQVILVGLSDDTSRKIVLLPGGADVPDDGLPAVPLADLLRRAFKHVFALVSVLRSDVADTVNVYEARSAEFHTELRREIYAAVIAGGQVAYMDAEDVEEGMAVDQATMTPLPRVPGSEYCCWPDVVPAAQGVDE